MSDYQSYAQPEVIEWLLAGDPSVRWQVQRDLLGEPPAVYEATRARVAGEGWGADYLGRQTPDGRWGCGLYGPKWISTHYTLLTLRRLGLPPGHPQALKGARLILDKGARPDQGLNFIVGEPDHSETCISGMGLSFCAYFAVDDARVHALAEHLLEQQMADGGWNCETYRGATHSSFHTCCSVLEGLREFHQRYPDSELPIRQAMEQGHEFFLRHWLYKSHHTGELVSAAMTRFPFPSGWQYDVLKGLDHFQAAGAQRDERAQDAIELLLSKRGSDGRWKQYRNPSGRYFFEIEAAGQPGRWNTLRALRVLKWWFGG